MASTLLIIVFLIILTLTYLNLKILSLNNKKNLLTAKEIRKDGRVVIETFKLTRHKDQWLHIMVFAFSVLMPIGFVVGLIQDREVNNEFRIEAWYVIAISLLTIIAHCCMYYKIQTDIDALKKLRNVK